MDYGILLNYGVLGMWTISLITEKLYFQQNMKKLITDNTMALQLLNERLKGGVK